MPRVGIYLFLLGLACGITVLTTLGYRHVTPSWLRGFLIATGLFTASRYVAMALFTAADAPSRFWGWHYCWFASSLGLTIPSVFAVDQLLRHPAMTPTKLLRWCAPLIAIYAAVILFGRVSPGQDPLGWVPRLGGAWQLALSVTQGLFVVSFIATCGLFMVKVPSRPIRIGLFGLALAQSYLALDGIILALGHAYFRPYLYSDILALLAIWFAFETGAALQQQSL